MTNQEWSKDIDKWSLQDLIYKGTQLTRDAQEGDAVYRDQFIAVDVHNRFVIWRIGITDFLYREGYVETTHPLYIKIGSLLEADSVPMLKGGIEYGDPRSLKSQVLLRNIREETKAKLKILRDILPHESKSNLTGKTLNFDGRSATLTIGGIPFVIKKASNQFIVARAIFSRGKAGRKVSWKGLLSTKQAVKDAVRGINAGLQKTVKVNEPLLVWDEGYIVRKL